MHIFLPLFQAGRTLTHLPTVFVTNAFSTLLTKWRYDGDYTRFALLIAAPYLICVSLVSPAA
jgi:hypothetical protein